MRVIGGVGWGVDKKALPAGETVGERPERSCDLRELQRGRIERPDILNISMLTQQKASRERVEVIPFRTVVAVGGEALMIRRSGRIVRDAQKRCRRKIRWRELIIRSRKCSERSTRRAWARNGRRIG